MEFIDTHTHNSDEAFAGCEDDIISRALDAGVKVMLQPDIDSRERRAMFDICSRHPGVLYPMIGLYPGSIDSDWRDEMDSMVSFREKAISRGVKIVAMGEIGLDYHCGTRFRKEQMEVLRIQLEMASEWGLPVNIHLRDATEDFFSVMEDAAHLGLRGNLHAFSGSYETFVRMQRYGDWRVGIGGVLTFKKASIAEDIKKIPLERILLETDAPYLSPTPHRGERNESSMIPIIATKIAELKGTDIETVAEQTSASARTLFSI